MRKSEMYLGGNQKKPDNWVIFISFLVFVTVCWLTFKVLDAI